MAGPSPLPIRSVWPPAAAVASQALRRSIARRDGFVWFVLSVAAANAAALLGNALVFRWVDPASFGRPHQASLWT